MSWFRKNPPPPPLPFYKKSPIATGALILTFIGMFVLGPIGAVYQGLTEELKGKANNETVLMYMKQQKEIDQRQWEAIQQQIQRPAQNTMAVPEKPPLSPKEYQQYMQMSPADRAGFRKLHPSYSTLPK